MNDKATIADIQRKASLSPKKSVLSVAAADAKEFQERNQDAGQAWQDSSDVKQCQKCSSKFSLTNRKHHCRECGQVYCGKCSAYKIVIAGALKRVRVGLSFTLSVSLLSLSYLCIPWKREYRQHVQH